MNVEQNDAKIINLSWSTCLLCLVKRVCVLIIIIIYYVNRTFKIHEK